MITCRLTHCPKIGKCKLVANGAIDLCPMLQAIKAEAIEKTEAAWRDKYPEHEVVLLEHYQGTWTTGAEGFSLNLGLGKIAALALARREATLKLQAYHDKHKLTPVEPRPEPKKVVPEKSDLYFHEMPTLTGDYSAYPLLMHVEDAEVKEMKAKEEVTRKQKQYWREVNARTRIQRKEDEREVFLMQLLYDMDDK